MLASAMNFWSFFAAVIIGSFILTIIGSLVGGIGAHTHLASAFNSRFTLGTGGAKIFGLIIAVSLFGWFGYQCSYFASSTISTLKMFNISGGNPTVWAVVGGLAMMITAVIGFKGIKWLSNIGVPLLFVLVAVAAIITAVKVDFSDLRAASAAAKGGMSISSAILTVVGSFIAGACTISDFSRFSKEPKDATYGCILGFMISFPIILLLGGFFYYAYSSFDLCDVFITYCGLGLFAAVVLIISTWTTNDNNLYSSVLGITNAIGDKLSIPRWLLTVIVGLISTLLGALGIMNYFTAFLSLLGVLIPPVAAVIIADYYIYNKKTGLYEFENVGKLKSFRINTCVSSLVGMAVGLICNYTTLLSGLCAIIPSCIVAMAAAILCLVIYNAIAPATQKTGIAA
jgi:cytosine permease